jgi:TLC domain.
MISFDTVTERITYYFLATIAWTLIFLVVNKTLRFSSKIPKKEADDLRNRVVSIMHGLFALFVSGYHIYKDKPQYADPATPIQHLILITSGAYFLYDTIACHYYGLTDMSLYIHHIMCTVGILTCEITNNATTALSKMTFNAK